jgi:hypothetical protein
METTRDEATDGLGPAFNPRRAVQVGLAGLLLAGLAMIPTVLSTRPTQVNPPTEALSQYEGIRAGLTFLSVLVAAVGLYLRPSAPTLLIAAGTCAVAWVGTPWDSARLLFGVLGILALLGAGLSQVPLRVRQGFVCGMILLHFGGILTAVTSPLHPPWLSLAIWTWVYRPYLQFMYLNNAYHFYSPDPGPANQLWFCFVYQEPDPKTGGKQQWVTFPRRPEDVKDPMAVEYYRRLSITEQTSTLAISTGIIPDSILQARNSVTNIRIHPDYPIGMQYRALNETARRYLMPAYVRRGVANFGDPNRTMLRVKLYRAEHRILPASDLAKRLDPYDPTTFLPIYLGDFTPQGQMLNPTDPMLYWVVPILKTPRDPNRPSTRWDSSAEFVLHDYVKEHAGSSPFSP